ncbi:lantibiotic dehydratase [Kinneretia aquatilis]|nr:lantibiotic dehydratase [Paucibacter aquatile]
MSESPQTHDLRARALDAIFNASRSLHTRIVEEAGACEGAFLRYLLRMSLRCTPFGTMAGITHCRVGSQDNVRFVGAARYERHLRLDSAVVQGLVQRLLEDDDVIRSVRIRVASSLHVVGRRAYYVRPAKGAAGLGFLQKSVAIDDALHVLISGCPDWTDFHRIEWLVRSVSPESSSDEITEYVGELIRDGVLETDLSPPITGEPHDAWLRQRVYQLPDSKRSVAERLAAIGELLQSKATLELPFSVDDYRRVERLLEPLLTAEDAVIQADMVKPAEIAEISDSTLNLALRDLGELLPLLLERAAVLDDFTHRFIERFGDQRVPLLQALDPEHGVGLDGSAADLSPLTAGLALKRAGAQGTAVMPALAGMVLGALTPANISRRLIELDEAKVLRHKVGTRNVPRQLYGLVSFLQETVGGPKKTVLYGVGAPCPSVLLGRFGFASKDLRDSLLAFLEADEEIEVADIAHLPNDKLGNVVQRPTLRTHEISYLGRAAESAIEVQARDIDVSVVEGCLVLRNSKTGKRIVPRMASAHSFYRSELAPYKFLCLYQLAGYELPAINLGEAVTGLAYCPRVTYKTLIVLPERWRLSAADMAALRTIVGTGNLSRMRDWREQLRLPSTFCYAEGDNVLTVDSGDIQQLRAWLEIVRNDRGVALTESLQNMRTAWVSGPEGLYCNEFIVPFEIDRREPTPRLDLASPLAAAPLPVARQFLPGVEWVYLKIYCGVTMADSVLQAMGERIRGLAAVGLASNWFFIRYGDPQPHLRIRVRCPGNEAEVSRSLVDHAASLGAEAGIASIQLDTYQREIERYGGADAIGLAEAYFHHDAVACLELIALLSPNDRFSDQRWLLALHSAMDILDQFVVVHDERLTLARSLRDSFFEEFEVDGEKRAAIGKKYRHYKPLIEGKAVDATPVQEVLLRRRCASSEIAARLRAQLGSSALRQCTSSLMHMTVNRLLHARAREQEAVIYDFLEREIRRQAAMAAMVYRPK